MVRRTVLELPFLLVKALLKSMRVALRSRWDGLNKTNKTDTRITVDQGRCSDCKLQPSSSLSCPHTLAVNGLRTIQRLMAETQHKTRWTAVRVLCLVSSLHWVDGRKQEQWRMNQIVSNHVPDAEFLGYQKLCQKGLHIEWRKYTIASRTRLDCNAWFQLAEKHGSVFATSEDCDWRVNRNNAWCKHNLLIGSLGWKSMDVTVPLCPGN
jgi:hypothetical protein